MTDQITKEQRLMSIMPWHMLALFILDVGKLLFVGVFIGIVLTAFLMNSPNF